MDITQLSLIELKALGFDLQNQIAVLQASLVTVTKQIDLRQSEMPVPIDPIPPAPSPFPPFDEAQPVV